MLLILFFALIFLLFPHKKSNFSQRFGGKWQFCEKNLVESGILRKKIWWKHILSLNLQEKIKNYG